MAGYPPPYAPPPGFDPRAQRQYQRDQARAQRDLFRAQAQEARYRMRALRRSSVLGPILLIAAGIVFLLVQTGRVPAQRLWEWYAAWWPSLFLAAGVILLAEWAWDQYSQRGGALPQYRRTVGGGIFTLLFLVGLTGFGASQARMHMDDGWYHGWHMNPDDLDQFLGDKHESDQTLDLLLPPGNSLEVTNPRGDVTLSGTSDDGHIHIAVHKQVFSRTDAEADSRTQRLDPAASTAGTTVRLAVPAVDGARADLVITLPPGTPCTITSNRGDIHVASLKAPLTATANHGDIELTALTGPATAHINNNGSSLAAHSLAAGLTVLGHVQDVTLTDITGPVSITGEYFGTTHLQRIAGPIHFRTSRTDFQMQRLDGEVEISPDADLSASQVLGPLVLTTSNRNITLERIAGDVSVTNKNGSIDLTATPGLGAITLQNKNGSIKAILPSHAGFSVQASTVDGEITNQFGLDPAGTDSRKEMNGIVGAGGPTIHIVTTHGDIFLNKGDILPLPPLPPIPPRLTGLPLAPTPPSLHAVPGLPSTPRSPRMPTVPTVTVPTLSVPSVPVPHAAPATPSAAPAPPAAPPAN